MSLRPEGKKKKNPSEAGLVFPLKYGWVDAEHREVQSLKDSHTALCLQ